MNQPNPQPNPQSNKLSIYDLIIVGAGPAGLTASIYASRYKLANLVIGKVLGGTITLAHKVENFPGFLAISGSELGNKIIEQARALGAEILAETVGRIEKKEDGFKVLTEGGKEVEARALIIAAGTERRKLGVPGEKEYLGKGVSYCVTCDAHFFRDKVVALIGGSNAACSGAIHAADFAKKTYIIYRRDKLRADPIWVEEALANPKIEVIYDTNVKEILGDTGKVTGLRLDKPYQGADKLPLDGIFIEIGGVPVISLLAPLGVKIDESGYIEVAQEMSTNVPGVFAAGDITNISCFLQQAITACAQGAIAVASAFKFLKNQKAPRLLGGLK